MKIGYVDLDGYEQTAYMDDDEVRDGPMRGTHKHTDSVVWIVWNEVLEVWQEVAAP